MRNACRVLWKATGANRADGKQDPDHLGQKPGKPRQKRLPRQSTNMASCVNTTSFTQVKIFHCMIYLTGVYTLYILLVEKEVGAMYATI